VGIPRPVWIIVCIALLGWAAWDLEIGREGTTLMAGIGAWTPPWGKEPEDESHNENQGPSILDPQDPEVKAAKAEIANHLRSAGWEWKGVYRQKASVPKENSEHSEVWTIQARRQNGEAQEDQNGIELQVQVDFLLGPGGPKE
jgi:hypothetical protein